MPIYLSRSLVCVLVLIEALILVNASEDSKEETEESFQTKMETSLHKFLPSKTAIEEVGVQFLDVLIKAGQIEMAKGAFRTQLDVLKKVHPDQYSKYKKIPIEQLAADAVYDQAETAKFQQKTGNRLIDMLHENGIPIGTSIRGLQQAIRTQKEMEKSDPGEQIAKAVFEKFQKQILPGLVANLIAGRNPLQLPQRQDVQKLIGQGNAERFLKAQHEQAMQQLNNDNIESIGKVQEKQYDIRPMIGQGGESEIRRKPVNTDKVSSEDEEEETGNEDFTEYVQEEEDESREEDDPEKIPKNNNRINHIKRCRTRTKRQSSTGRLFPDTEPEDDQEELIDQATLKLGTKASLLLGLHEIQGIEHSDEEDEPPRRKQALEIPTSLASKIRSSPQLKVLFENEELAYKLNDPEHMLEPKSIIQDPKPQPGFVPLRTIPKRPRKMLPLIVGVDEEENRLDSIEEDEKEVKNPFSGEEETLHDFPRRHPEKVLEVRTVSDDRKYNSRVLENLRNNPALAPIFEDDDLAERLSRPNVVSDGQRMSSFGVQKKWIYPRAYAASIKNRTPSDMDSKVKQLVEERPIPPLFFTPKGKHTRLRWTGATERELPGVGGRFIVPSLDPTMPAINSVVTTQGKQRDEYDSTFKIPNFWEAGDTLGVQMKTKSERLIGGNGAVDFPAMGHDDLHFG